MATKIRLQRHGKKGKPFFHIIATDARTPRDGRFIEKLGTYDPTANPATIDIHFDRCLHWVKVGAEPTNTADALVTLKVTEIQIRTGGIAGVEETEVKGEVSIN